MKKRKPFIFLAIYLISLIIFTGCNKPPKQDMGEAVLKTEDYFKRSKGIDCVGAFDGDTVKFRLLIKEQPTVDEVEKLFSVVLKTIEKYTNNEETWDYYNATLDIVYEDNIIFVGSKESGDHLVVREK